MTIENMTLAEVLETLAVKGPEAKALKTQLEVAQAEIKNLQKRHDELTGNVDRRKDVNPLRNLKVSVRRSFLWAKMYHRTADEAREKATKAALESASQRYANELQSYLETNTLPPTILEYIEACYENYGNIDTAKVKEKKPRKAKVSAAATTE